MGIAIATFIMKEYEKAIPLFEDVKSKLEPPQKTSALYYLAMCYHEKGDLNKAIDLLYEGLSILPPNLMSRNMVIEKLYESKRYQLLSKLMDLLYQQKEFGEAFLLSEKYRALNLISILKLDTNPMLGVGPFSKLVNFLALSGLSCVEYFISVEYIEKKNVTSQPENTSTEELGKEEDLGKEDLPEEEEGKEKPSEEENVFQNSQPDFERKEFLYVFIVNASSSIHCERLDLSEALKESGIEEKKIGESVYKLRELLGIKDDPSETHFLDTQLSSQFEEVGKESLENAKRYLQFFHKVLFGCVLDRLESEDVVIVPNKELFLLPFCVLEDSQGEPLLEKLNISLSPSLYALLSIRQCNYTPTRDPEDKALIVGDPSPSSLLTNTITDKKPNLPTISSIPHWQDEISTISDTWKKLNVSEVISGSKEECNNEFFYKSYPKSKYIHFATHFCAEEISPSVPHYGKISLASSGETPHAGWISAHLSNYRLPFSSQIVSLSSVITLSGKIKGENFSDSLQSFFRSGSHSVLSPICSFPSHSFSQFFQSFYQMLSKFPQNSAKALRHAQIQLRKNSPLDCNPLLWGSFILFGSTDPFLEDLSMPTGVSQYTIF